MSEPDRRVSQGGEPGGHDDPLCQITSRERVSWPTSVVSDERCGAALWEEPGTAMATVMASCGDCGDVELRVNDLRVRICGDADAGSYVFRCPSRSEEHTSELQA